MVTVGAGLGHRWQYIDSETDVGNYCAEVRSVGINHVYVYVYCMSIWPFVCAPAIRFFFSFLFFFLLSQWWASPVQIAPSGLSTDATAADRRQIELLSRGLPTEVG